MMGYHYVDKTGMAVDLIEQGKYYFWSRPRRFGKSLLLDTLKNLFKGHQSLFTGLAAETRWDWTQKYRDEIRRSNHGYNWLASRNIAGFEVETLAPSLG